MTAPESAETAREAPVRAVEPHGNHGAPTPPVAPSPQSDATLTLAADLVESVAAQTRTPAEALALLEAHGGSPDREALSEAVAALHLRDRFLAHDGDPWEWTGVPTASPVRVWDLAVELCEDALASNIRALAMQP